MSKIKINAKELVTGEAVIITPFVGFGDLLYHTPVIRILSRVYHGVDIWGFNQEPFFNNPYVHKLFKIDHDTVGVHPVEFYFDFTFEVSGDSNVFVKNLYPSNVYSPEYFSLAIIHCNLPDNEKHLTYNWLPSDITSVRVKSKGALSSKDKIITTVNPAIGWPSRTLPFEYYRVLIEKITALGDIVILTGKEVNPQRFMPTHSRKEIDPVFKKNETKGLYTIEDLMINENVIDLTNQLTLGECAALYSLTDIALNTENGNMVISGTNDHCWNLYIPTLTAPEYRAPYRKGSQSYRTTIVYNKNRHYPGSDFKQLRNGYDYINVAIELPSIEDIFEKYCETREHILKTR